MNIPALSIDEYLRTNYRPDRDYVDGRTMDRNWGERTHGRVQANLIVYLARLPGVEVFPELRIQVSPMRIRVPDLTVVQEPSPNEEIFTSPPHLCIEILSINDTADFMQEKIDDYLRFGVPYIWIINPRLRKGYVVTTSGMVEAESGILKTQAPALSLPVAALFD